MNWNIYFQAFTVRTWRKRLSNLNTFLTPHIYWGIHIKICVNYNQHRGALILDLASRPGGTDFAAARELGLRAEHALSLPARCAPETAGALVAHTVEVILQERAATARSERGVS